MGEKLSLQNHFSSMVAMLIQQAQTMGFQISLGECYRTVEQAQLNAQKGIGIADSLHCERLAIDVNLFKDDEYLTDTNDYEPLGVWWESIGGKWGGRFSKPDGNHFSLGYHGRA